MLRARVFVPAAMGMAAIATAFAANANDKPRLEKHIRSFQ
jgi:hypothetical protein